MNRILFEAAEVGGDGSVVLCDRRAVHIERVLGCRDGDVVRVGVIGGPLGTARVTGCGTGHVQLDCTLDAEPLPATGISLLLALPRPKVMRRLWAPLASLGVRRIVLTNAAKVERQYFDTHWLDPAVYRPLLIEGLEQSGDTTLPDVHICRRFKPFIEDQAQTFFGNDLRLVCHPRNAIGLRERMPTTGAIVVAIGPEGGWTDYEIDLMQEYAFQCTSFGLRTLRTDVAVMAILGALLAAR